MQINYFLAYSTNFCSTLHGAILCKSAGEVVSSEFGDVSFLFCYCVPGIFCAVHVFFVSPLTGAQQQHNSHGGKFVNEDQFAAVFGGQDSTTTTTSEGKRWQTPDASCNPLEPLASLFAGSLTVAHLHAPFVANSFAQSFTFLGFPVRTSCLILLTDWLGFSDEHRVCFMFHLICVACMGVYSTSIKRPQCPAERNCGHLLDRCEQRRPLTG